MKNKNLILYQKLGLSMRGLRRTTLADNSKEICKVTEPVEIQWQDRTTALRAVVIPNTTEVLLGALPLEDMDLIVDPKHHTLVGAHGDDVVCLVM